MENDNLNLPTGRQEKIRHSLSHLMSMAVQEIFPKVGLGVGPAIDNGFYQDYDTTKPITQDMLPKLEKRMRELIAEDIKFERHYVEYKDAIKFYKHDPYKTWFIKDLKKKKQKLSFYKSGCFDNLCGGPHVKSTKEINPDAFKLTKVAGAYWQGDEKNKMLTRIYGLAFNTKKELNDYIKLQEEAEKRDHRKLGKELDLFTFSDIVGKGLPLYTEKGSAIRRELERLVVDEELKRNYKQVYTPDLAKVDLYKKSGHYPYYKDTMYPVMKVDNEELILRPMTCPHHYQLFLAKPRSYRELPFKIAELAKQYRYEKSGELTGLIRVRTFCLADSHIICEKNQAEEQINEVLDLIDYMANVFGLKINIDYSYRLSLGERKNTKKYYKDDKAWDFAENVLRKVLKQRGKDFYEDKDEAAFYGPKIDVQMKNFAGREDTAFTVQYDFVGPKRFDLVYTDENGKKKEATVIHRSSIGAIERTMAFLIERYAGAFPVWLSPVQVAIVPIADRHEEYAKKVAQKLSEEGIRFETKYEAETLGKKIRSAEMQKIPYLLVIGDKEAQGQLVSVRERGKGDTGQMPLEKFIKKIKNQISNRQ